MTEEKYIDVSNRVRINIAITSLKEVLCMGILGDTDEVLLMSIRSTLRDMEDRLFASFDLET